MAKDPLVQLSRFARPASAVGHRQVVEYQQLSGLQSDGDLSLVHAHAVVLEEPELGQEAVKLQPAGRVQGVRATPR